MRTRSVLLVVLALSPFTQAGGCGPGLPAPHSDCEASPAPADGSEQVIIGRLDDNDAFQPLADGVELPRELGGQGGSHVSVALRVYAAAGATWEHDFSLTETSTTEPFAASMVQAPTCAPGWSVTRNLRVVMRSFGATPPPTGLLTVESGPVDDPSHRLRRGPIQIRILQ